MLNRYIFIHTFFKLNSDILCCCAVCRRNATREQSPGEPHRHPARRRFNSQPVRQQRGRIHVSPCRPFAPRPANSPASLSRVSPQCVEADSAGDPEEPGETPLLFCILRCLSVSLCSNLMSELRQVFAYDPYDDSYQAVPMSRYQTVYITPGVGPGMLRSTATEISISL